MKIFVRAGMLLLLTAVGACGSPAPKQDTAGSAIDSYGIDAVHDSRNSLDWDGVYTAVLPCADCEGIRVSVTLRRDGSFTRELVYVGKSTTAIVESGEFAWNDSGSVVRLPDGAGGTQQYQVGENRLFHLDRNGNRISGDLADRYVLRKVTRDARLEDTTWVLIELMGDAVVTPEGGKRPFLRFSSDEARLGGNASCNSFFGRYVLAPNGGLRIGGNLGSTMMACPDMSIEDRFMSVLIDVDTYAVSGNQLTLSRGSAAPVMRFEAAPE